MTNHSDNNKTATHRFRKVVSHIRLCVVLLVYSRVWRRAAVMRTRAAAPALATPVALREETGLGHRVERARCFVHERKRRRVVQQPVVRCDKLSYYAFRQRPHTNLGLFKYSRPINNNMSRIASK